MTALRILYVLSIIGCILLAVWGMRFPTMSDERNISALVAAGAAIYFTWKLLHSFHRERRINHN